MDSFEKDMKAAIQSNDQGLAAKKALEYLQKTENLPVNIAVTGESGSGKSTLINALRGVDNRDEAAAPTGYVETTLKVTKYQHPEFPNITIWDLPGIGTSTFKASEYLKAVEFDKFDFFIIVSNNRFKENDGLLAAEIQKMNKKFYFVRSKIDDTINAAKRSQRGFEEEKALKQIRENCIAELEKIGNLKSPKIFLVSSLDPQMYEFDSLLNTTKEELPAKLRETLLLALPNISMNVIDEKKAALEANIKWRALTSALVAAVPIPGTSFVVDLVTTINFVKDCQKSLGLTYESLLRLSFVTDVSMEDIKAEMKSPLAGVKITKELVMTVLRGQITVSALMALEEGSRVIPILGIPFAMGLSAISTYKVLQYLLASLADDAQRVFAKAMKLTTPV